MATTKHTDPKHLSNEELSEVLDKTAEESATSTQMTQIFFWVGTTLIAGAVALIASIFMPGASVPGISTSAAQILGPLSALAGATSLYTSLQYSRQAAIQTEQNDKAYSVRQARDNAESMVEILQEHGQSKHKRTEAPEVTAEDTSRQHWTQRIEPKPAAAQKWQDLVSACQQESVVQR